MSRITLRARKRAPLLHFPIDRRHHPLEHRPISAAPSLSFALKASWRCTGSHDNLIRALMQRAALTYDVDLERISFKGSLDSLHHYADAIYATHRKPRKQAHLSQLISVSELFMTEQSGPAQQGEARL